MVRSRTVLGFDFGRERIGVAIGQELTATARPLVTLPVRAQRPDWDAISQLISEWRPDLLVVGVPRHADGSPSATTAHALRFSRQLQGRYRLAVETIDERLSSREAQGLIAEAMHLRRRQRRDKATIDQVAAALILESWFHHQGTPTPCRTSND